MLSALLPHSSRLRRALARPATSDDCPHRRLRADGAAACACVRARRVLSYLQGIQAQVSNGSSAAVGSGLRPTEVLLSSGCIEEIDANYKGDLLSGVLSNVASGDACCQQCRPAQTPAPWLCGLSSACRCHAAAAARTPDA